MLLRRLSGGLLLAAAALAPLATAQSVNVGIIGGPNIINGGVLPTAGGAFAAFNFQNITIANANAAFYAAQNLDTVVLNVASSAMGCTTATLSASQKADLNTFVNGGGKLIIYDSECTFGGSVDYSWLTYPFNTVNPGPAGAFGGTLTIFEDNALSSANPADPQFIDSNAITSQTDAVGDMNVVDLTTVHPAWCLDMTGTNSVNFTGTPHMYARDAAGVLIYNGFDVDFIASAVGPTGGGQLAKIWLQELQTSNSQSDLPCGVPVNGITLTPGMATNNVGTPHTVTATVGTQGVPLVGALVTFAIVSGPNTGASGVCTPPTCLTDVNGQVSFTYTGGLNTGTDMIVASFFDPVSQTIITSQPASKTWVSECYLLLGLSSTSYSLGPDPDDELLVDPLILYPVITTQVPPLYIPNDPGLVGLPVFAQVGMYNPTVFPNNPLSMSNGWRVVVGQGAQSYGTSTRVLLAGNPIATLGQNYNWFFVIQ
ncbi:MAG: hypothetical protein KDE27_26245 [Planctomycetes bacterium]|nr:hypothetical protein [Planctomycetota bacterium]